MRGKRNGRCGWKVRGIIAALIGSLAPVAAGADEGLWRQFLTPPSEARPLVRWWWFGPSVTDAELDREIAQMRAGGFGGFEIQPVYPLTLDGVPGMAANQPYLSDTFIGHVRHAATSARAAGLRVDMTLGSGWPFGGPHVSLAQASALVRMARVPVAADATDVVLPALAQGEALLGAALLETGGSPQSLALAGAGDALRLPRGHKAGELLVFISGHSGQQVKRAAVGAEGFVIDHANPDAVSHHLATVGDRLMQGFAGIAPPDAVFSDSLEAYGASWTADLPEQFRRRRGYDLIDHLPALFLDLPDSGAVRHDWARTLSELVDERYLRPIDAWARARGTRFRAQVYGYPPPTLSSNRLVAIPEGEGANWRDFTSTRWATSGAHLYGKPVASAEVWTWLHSPAWAATPLDMKVEADRHFLQGVTQIVGHGWPYSPPGAAEPGWAFYAAAALNDHNPWYAAMPAVNRYLTRLSWLLRQGEAANGAAIYLPVEDAMAAMTPKAASINEALHHHLPGWLTPAVLDAGYGFDFVDAQAVRDRPLPHRVLILPPIRRIDADAIERIVKWARQGGQVVAVGGLPSESGGLRDAAQARRVRAAVKALRALPTFRLVADEVALAPALRQAARPDVQMDRPLPDLGFVRRRLPQGDVYFLANTGNQPMATRLTGIAAPAAWWNPMTGTREAADPALGLDLAPYETRVLVTGALAADAPAPIQAGEAGAVPLKGWTLATPGDKPRPLAGFASWSQDAAHRHVSGVATYSVTVDLPAAADRCWTLDMGEARPRAVAKPDPARPVAEVETPVREAAIVRVNGVEAGTLWAPPYRLAVGPMLRAGTNRIDIAVPNSALNVLSGRPRPDRSLLTARYGERFTDQDVDRIAPVPSGLLEPVRLLKGACP